MQYLDIDIGVDIWFWKTLILNSYPQFNLEKTKPIDYFLLIINIIHTSTRLKKPLQLKIIIHYISMWSIPKKTSSLSLPNEVHQPAQ